MRGEYPYSEPPAGAVTCLHCGRVSIGMTLAETEAAVAAMNAHLRPGEPRVGVDYFRCCRRPRYRLARLGDVPDGATISAVLFEGLVEG